MQAVVLDRRVALRPDSALSSQCDRIVAASVALTMADYTRSGVDNSRFCSHWQKGYGSVCLPQYLRKGAMVSMGMGKIVVEFLSAEISTRVWRYRSCKAAGFRLITSAASARRRGASNSTWAWGTFARR